MSFNIEENNADVSSNNTGNALALFGGGDDTGDSQDNGSFTFNFGNSDSDKGSPNNNVFNMF